MKTAFKIPLRNLPKFNLTDKAINNYKVECRSMGKFFKSKSIPVFCEFRLQT